MLRVLAGTYSAATESCKNGKPFHPKSFQNGDIAAAKTLAARIELQRCRLRGIPVFEFEGAGKAFDNGKFSFWLFEPSESPANKNRGEAAEGKNCNGLQHKASVALTDAVCSARSSFLAQAFCAFPRQSSTMKSAILSEEKGCRDPTRPQQYFEPSNEAERHKKGRVSWSFFGPPP